MPLLQQHHRCFLYRPDVPPYILPPEWYGCKITTSWRSCEISQLTGRSGHIWSKYLYPSHIRAIGSSNKTLFRGFHSPTLFFVCMLVVIAFLFAYICYVLLRKVTFICRVFSTPCCVQTFTLISVTSCTACTVWDFLHGRPFRFSACVRFSALNIMFHHPTVLSYISPRHSRLHAHYVRLFLHLHHHSPVCLIDGHLFPSRFPFFPCSPFVFTHPQFFPPSFPFMDLFHKKGCSRACWGAPWSYDQLNFKCKYVLKLHCGIFTGELQCNAHECIEKLVVLVVVVCKKLQFLVTVRFWRLSVELNWWYPVWTCKIWLQCFVERIENKCYLVHVRYDLLNLT